MRSIGKFIGIAMIVLVIGLAVPGYCYEVNDKFSIDASLAGVYQYADGLDNREDDSYGRGSVASDIGLNFHPTEIDEFQVTLSFASGNGLHNKESFSLCANADDLEDDLKDINGRNRDYLLEAWYRHSFMLLHNISLGATFGIIDSTAYLDGNEFANDEVGQFMNEVFVNNPLLNLPSYDVGGELELSVNNFAIKGVVMGSRTDDWKKAGPDATRGFNYYGLELSYSLNTSPGQGNYRLTGYTTTEDFEGWAGEEEKLKGVGISIDQKIGELVGIFARLGWQDDDAQIDHDQLYSIGFNLNGNAWGREKDELGLGYAYLEGADKADIDNTHAVEGYVKFKVTDYSVLSLDVQYMKDNYKHGDDNDGMVYGARYAISF